MRKKIIDELLAAVKKIALHSEVAEYRPCYVNGRRALFHRWENTANPVLPRGVDANDEKARFFQYRSTRALVEYEDGTMARVWPLDIRFADGNRFKECEWLPEEALGVQNAEKET